MTRARETRWTTARMRLGQSADAELFAGFESDDFSDDDFEALDEAEPLPDSEAKSRPDDL
ncbi:MAG: hypothetical protein O2888_04865 [Chloroflexi bacterium]|nr:hypothetical protein [Chloroflexota bacterium]